MDSYIDYITHSIFYFVSHQVPMFCAPYFLYFYALFLKYLDKVKNQAKHTWFAIQNSFHEEFLGFVKCNNDQYFPFLMTSATKYSSDPVWIYDHNGQSFTYAELGFHATTRNLPFIGANLMYKNNSVGDLSDWLMDQKVHGPDSTIPLQVLVGAWRFYFDRTYMFSYKDYSLTVITDDGEETTYNLETGKQSIEEPGTSVFQNNEVKEQTDKKTE